MCKTSVSIATSPVCVNVFSYKFVKFPSCFVPKCLRLFLSLFEIMILLRTLAPRPHHLIACDGMGCEHPDPGRFGSLQQHPAPSIAAPFTALPSLSRTPRASEARTRAKLRGNGCLFDRGGWAAWSERRAA